MDETERLRTEVEGAIGWLTIDRPEMRGALTRAMWEAMPAKLEALAGRDGVRAVVIRGSGGSFVAGADINEFATLRSNPELARRYDEGARATIGCLERLSVPSIAMIDGPCIGGGCLIAFACDFRLCSERAALGIPAGRLGLAYPYEALERLVAAVGEMRALDLVLTGRIVKGPEAARLGLVLDCVAAEELEGRVRGQAGAIARMAPRSIRYARTAIRRRAAPAVERAVIEELAAACFASSDYDEGVTAFFEKRDPRFTGR